MIGSYTKILALGHRMLNELLLDPVTVEEKIDGSQMAVQLVDGELRFRSRSQELIPDAPQKMFIPGISALKEIAHLFTPGWIYRGEYLSKPHHNALAYERAPARHFIIFDIDRGTQDFMTHAEKSAEAARLGLEVVPLIYEGMVSSKDAIIGFMDHVSCLGGQKIEGVVVKNYKRAGADGKILMGKFVSEAFKEVHNREWKKSNPSGKDILGRLGDDYRTPARWNKAIQHLSERGQLTNSPKDIGPLLKEIQSDVMAECKEEIGEKLFTWARPHVTRAIISGFPEWYKERLLEKQFENGDADG